MALRGCTETGKTLAIPHNTLRKPPHRHGPISSETTSEDAASKPLIWVLEGPKAGDNTQTRTLADAVAQGYGWRSRSRRLHFRPTELLTNLTLRITRAGLTAASDPLVPPWPDVVITAGRRNEPVARWIQRQSPATRLVHVGRPWTSPRYFDLIVTTSQYFVPPAANVLELPLPLLPLDPIHVELHPTMVAATRPRIAVLVGGNSGSIVLDAWHGEQLGTLARRLATANHGSLFVTTSPRTPRAAADALERAVHPAVLFHRWTANAADNPYRALLAHADEFVVTGESASMLAEAAATSRPVHIYDVQERWLDSRRTWLAGLGWKPITHRLAQRLAPKRFRRDICRLHQHLESAGLARKLGDDGAGPLSKTETWDPAGALATAAARVAALL